MSIEVMKQALEFLDGLGRNHWGNRRAVMDNLRAAIEQAEKQEPVGEVLNERGEIDYISYVPPVGTPLYTTLPTAQRQPLTDEEIAVIAAASGGLASDFVVTVARAIEAAHGIGEKK
jgi:hypothetical protein